MRGRLAVECAAQGGLESVDFEAREGEGRVLRLRWKRRAQENKEGQDEEQYGGSVGTVG